MDDSNYIHLVMAGTSKLGLWPALQWCSRPCCLPLPRACKHTTLPRYIGHMHGGTGLSVFGHVPNLFQHVGWASTARFKEKVHGRGRFTSKTFTWMTLAQVEAAIRDETI